MVIRNGVKNGYTFLESIRSIVDVADEFLISDGHSTDGTYDYLKAAAKRFKNINLFQDEWTTSNHGEAIAVMTNTLKARANCKWIYNIQADEVVHESFLPKLLYLTEQNQSDYRSFAVKFLHFVGDFFHVETNPGYRFAVRLVPNCENIQIVGDGWTFDGDINPVGFITDPPLFHFGWVYARNNIFKRKHQAKYIYQDEETYQKDYEFCREIEKSIDENSEDFSGWQRKMLSSRRIRNYRGTYPKVALHLLEKGNMTYHPDPYILNIPSSHLLQTYTKHRGKIQNGDFVFKGEKDGRRP
jgi:glycosyltransferase involved in cell wall biosynthesis